MNDKQTTLGDPMYVESLMTKEEWQARMILYPKTSHLKWNYCIRPKPNSFKWRYRMGHSLSPSEINNRNTKIDAVLNKNESNT